MNIYIHAVGKLGEEYLRNAAAEYIKRCSRWGKLAVVEIPESRLPKSAGASDIAKAVFDEGEAMLAKLPRKAYVIGLFIEGEELASDELASLFSNVMNSGKNDIVFLIGGSHGMSQKVKESCNLTLSFSKMTFPHQLARVMLCEQIYRALTIISGQEYHK